MQADASSRFLVSMNLGYWEDPSIFVFFLFFFFFSFLATDKVIRSAQADRNESKYIDSLVDVSMRNYIVPFVPNEISIDTSYVLQTEADRSIL